MQKIDKLTSPQNEIIQQAIRHNGFATMKNMVSWEKGVLFLDPSFVNIFINKMWSVTFPKQRVASNSVISKIRKAEGANREEVI